MRDIYIYQFQPEPSHRIHKDILPWNISQMKQCLEAGLAVVNMMESRWKLMQQHDQDFSMEGNRCRTNTRVRRKKEIQKIRTVRITVWDARGKLTV